MSSRAGSVIYHGVIRKNKIRIFGRCKVRQKLMNALSFLEIRSKYRNNYVLKHLLMISLMKNIEKKVVSSDTFNVLLY